MKRSPGIIVFGIIFILLGGYFLPFMPFFSVLYLIIGVGIFFLEPLIRYLAIGVSILGIIVNTVKLLGLLNKGISGRMITALVLTYLAHAAVIYFLTRPKVRAQFRH